MQKRSTLEKASLALAVVLLVCILPLPYGVYGIVRLATAVIALCWAFRFYNAKQMPLCLLACTVAVLFQPFAKITLGKDVWQVVDVLTAITVFVLIFRRHKSSC